MKKKKVERKQVRNLTQVELDTEEKAYDKINCMKLRQKNSINDVEIAKLKVQLLDKDRELLKGDLSAAEAQLRAYNEKLIKLIEARQKVTKMLAEKLGIKGGQKWGFDPLSGEVLISK